jgi:hypothetical protein
VNPIVAQKPILGKASYHFGIISKRVDCHVKIVKGPMSFWMDKILLHGGKAHKTAFYSNINEFSVQAIIGGVYRMKT